jgi:hypothetical protein
VVVLAEAAWSILFWYYLITESSKQSLTTYFYLTIRAFSLSCVIGTKCVTFLTVLKWENYTLILCVQET